MTLEEREIIRDFSKCDFTNIHHYLKQQAQIRKDRYIMDFVICFMIVCLFIIQDSCNALSSTNQLNLVMIFITEAKRRRLQRRTVLVFFKTSMASA